MSDLKTQVRHYRSFINDPPEPLDKYDRFGPFNPNRGLSLCPYCGNDIPPSMEVITVDGRRGTNAELTDSAPGNFLRTYHPRCFRKRELLIAAVENKSLFEFAES